MPAGPQAVLERFVTLLADYSLSSTSHGVSTLREALYDRDLANEAPSAIHRTFQVIYDSARDFGGTGGQFSGDTIDDLLLLRVQVAFHLAGGTVPDANNSLEADRSGTDALAAGDMNRVRQRLCNPVNYDGDNTGIVLVGWRGTRNVERDAAKQVAVYEAAFEVHVRHAVVS